MPSYMLKSKGPYIFPYGFVRVSAHKELIVFKLFFLFKIIHLKRFQFMNGRWVKSNKIVNFPMETFDPSEFVVKRSASTGNFETGEDSTFVRTVNVQTVVEDTLQQPAEQIPVQTHSDKVSA